ncbi:MAG: uracil-DNA glycosylase [Chloroflexi bacterium]|nr:uracil-DNA glycosylase [Chloroflexota bacterium]MBI3733796.1 uracil-DNA glycosylase [Chloroflexota bacterium]
MSELADLYAEIKACKACDLHQRRTQAVPGVGPLDARIMFIGEAPGVNEDKKGEPFVGNAGQFLNQLLALAGLKREAVYITNIVKSRPPENRDPLPQEIAACKPWLDRQLELIKPQVIVTLGRYSMARWFPGASISQIHGTPRKVGPATVIPMFHPAAALHQPKYKELIEADFRKLPKILADLASVKEAEKPKDDPKQLSLL